LQRRAALQPHPDEAVRKHEDRKRLGVHVRWNALAGGEANVAQMLEQRRRQAGQIRKSGLHLVGVGGERRSQPAFCRGIPDGRHQPPPARLVDQLAVDEADAVGPGWFG
jgi:hypothetical protein